METYQTREEIRRRILARMGQATNGDQAHQVLEQLNEFIRSACQEVYTRCGWANAQRETRVDVGIEQRFVNYPANATAANVLQVAVWDANAHQYCALRRARIPLALNNDPDVDAGEPDSLAGRGRPQLYDPKTQIALWPLPDQEYELKLLHTVSPELTSDAQTSIVDAEAIVLWALADAFDFQGDGQLAQTARQKFQARIAQLKAQQHTAESFRRGGLDELELSRLNKEPRPNYATRSTLP